MRCASVADSYAAAGIRNGDGVMVVEVPKTHELLSPIVYTVYTVPFQLLAYHAAVLRGTDVDQPRKLAKSVTVVGPRLEWVIAGRC